MYPLKKKLGIFAALILTLVAVSTVKAETTQQVMRPDIVCWGGFAANVAFSTTSPICIDYDGNIIAGKNLSFDIGEATRTFRTGYFGNVDVSSGLYNFSDTFVDLSSGNLQGLRQGGFNITTGTLISGGSTFIDGNIAQSSGAPRNITVFVSSHPTYNQMAAASGMSTTTFSGALQVFGYDNKGNFATETINFSTNTFQSSTITVTNSATDNGFLNYIGVGNVAWAKVTSMTVTITSMTEAYGLNTATPTINIGWGQKIGLSGNIVATTDIYKITEEGGQDRSVSSQFPAVTIDTTYDTIIFNRLPNGIDEKRVWGRVRRMHP